MRPSPGMSRTAFSAYSTPIREFASPSCAAPSVRLSECERRAGSDQSLVLRFVKVLPDERVDTGRTIDAGQVACEDHFCHALGCV